MMTPFPAATPLCSPELLIFSDCQKGRRRWWHVNSQTQKYKCHSRLIKHMTCTFLLAQKKMDKHKMLQNLTKKFIKLKLNQSTFLNFLKKTPNMSDKNLVEIETNCKLFSSSIGRWQFDQKERRQVVHLFLCGPFPGAGKKKWNSLGPPQLVGIGVRPSARTFCRLPPAAGNKVSPHSRPLQIKDARLRKENAPRRLADKGRKGREKSVRQTPHQVKWLQSMAEGNSISAFDKQKIENNFLYFKLPS